MEDPGGAEGYSGILSEVTTRTKGVVWTSRWEITKDGLMQETKSQNTGRRRSPGAACSACAARGELRALPLQRYRLEDCHSSEFEPWGDEPKLEFILVDITNHQAHFHFVCTSAKSCQEWVSEIRLMNGTYVFDMITRYVPNVLLQRLANDESLTQPSLDEFDGALLFTDISGFTALSEKLSKEYGPEEGSEELNRAINAFFEKMIGAISKHDGDIIKFAGDAMFVVWQCCTGMDLRAAVMKACQCAAALEEFNGDRVAAGRAHVALSLHMGLGAGQMMGLTVGDSKLRQEYVIAGETIKQVSDAEGTAADGQTVLSSRALSYVEPQFASLVRDDGMGVLDTEAMRMQYGSSSEGLSTERSGLEVGSFRNAKTRRRRYLEPLRSRVQETEFAKTQVTDQLRCFVPASVREVIDAGIYDSLGGLRPLTTMFVSIAISDGPSESIGWLPWLQYIYSVQLTVVGENFGTISRLQIDDKGVVTKSIFGLAGQNTESAMSALQAAFAIRDRLAEPAPNIPGMKQGLQVKVGVATGTIFAGVVGSAERCEYTSVGFTVNLAARLMQHAAKTPNRVVCDHPTKVSAELEVSEWREGTFGAAQRIVVKGAKDGMDVYFPSTVSGGATPAPRRSRSLSNRDEEENEMTKNSPLPKTEGAPDLDASSSSADRVHRVQDRMPDRMPSVDSDFEWGTVRTLHGRDAEIALINDAVAELAPDTHSRLLLLTGTTGSGKTAMIENVIRQAAAANDAQYFTGSGRSAGAAGGTLSLGCFRSTLARVLATAYRAWRSSSVSADRETYQQYLQRRLQQATGPDGDSSRETSAARSLGSYEAAKFLPLLNGEGVLPSENGIPLTFTTLDQTEHLRRFTFGNLRESRLLAVTSHLLDVFMERPAIIAIDEAQSMDERSFHLCRELLSTCSGVMIVVGYKTYFDSWDSDSSEDDVDILGPFFSEDTQTMDLDPFIELVAQHAAVSAEINLKPLTPEGARQLAAAELGVSQIDDDLGAFIEKRCHGIPRDIIEWINMLRDQRIITSKDDQCTTDVPGILEDEMLMSKLPATAKQRALAKIDSCNVTLRMITNYASVCHRITLQTLVFIVPTMRTANNESRMKFFGDALDELTDKGVLVLEDMRGVHAKERSWRFASSEFRAAAYGTLLHRQRVEIHELCAQDSSQSGELARQIRLSLRQSSVGGAAQLFDYREMADITAKHYEAAGKHMEAAEYKMLAGQLSIKDSHRGQALAAFKDAEELQQFFTPDPASWDANQACYEQFAMAKAWNGSDTEQALQHLVKALYLFWKVYTRRSTETQQELDYNSMNAEMKDLLTIIEVTENREKSVSTTSRKPGTHSVHDRSAAAKDLVVAELLFFELCLNRQDTSIGVTVMNGTKAIERAVTVVDNTRNFESINIWLKSHILACRCVSLLIKDSEGDRDTANEYAQRTTSLLATHRQDVDRDLAWTLVYLSRYHAAMDDLHSCCFRLGELYATADTLAETYFREVFLLELASLAQAEMDDRTALRIFRNLSASQHNAHRTEARVGTVRCLWRMVRDLGTEQDETEQRDLHQEMKLLDEELRKIMNEVQDKDGTIRRSYPLFYGEMHAIMGSESTPQKGRKSFPQQEPAVAASHIETATKIFDLAFEPTIYSAYFALESIVDATLEAAAASAETEASRARARSLSVSSSGELSRSSSSRKKRIASTRHGRGSSSSDKLTENEWKLDKLALHAQCHMVLVPRVVDIHRRFGFESRLPDWMLEHNTAAHDRRYANDMLTRYAMLDSFG